LRGGKCRAKSALVDGLTRESTEQAARLREARTEVERQAGQIAAKDKELSSARDLCEGLSSKFGLNASLPGPLPSPAQSR
jgi:hypothetical protein